MKTATLKEINSEENTMSLFETYKTEFEATAANDWEGRRTNRCKANGYMSATVSTAVLMLQSTIKYHDLESHTKERLEEIIADLEKALDLDKAAWK